MGAYGGTGKAMHGITLEQQQDLFLLPEDYSLAHCIPASIDDARGLACAFRKKFSRLAQLKYLLPTPGKTLRL